MRSFSVFTAVLVVLTTQVSGQMPNLKFPFPPGDGWHISCGYRCSQTHCVGCKDEYALDFAIPGCAASFGKPVLAVADGVVLQAYESRGGYGNTIVIDHGNGFRSRVAHLESMLVRVNVFVCQGQQIGICGATGNVSSSNPACEGILSAGAHIHFAFYYVGADGIIQARKPELMSGYEDFDVIQNPYYSDNEIVTNCGSKTSSPSIGVGEFAVPFTGSDDISNAFIRAHNFFQLPDGSSKLGQPHPSIPHVYEWGETRAFVQIFDQPDVSRPRFQDGFAWMMYNPDHRRCYVITMIFYLTYATVVGDMLYGLPLNNEHTDTSVGNLIGRPGEIFIRQDFSLEKTMLWGGNPAIVSVIDTPPGTVKIAGGATPLTPSGQAITKTQVFLTWNGGMELESNDTYVLKQNGSEVVTTTLREATLTNLTLY